jgi:hypothetical protein
MSGETALEALQKHKLLRPMSSVKYFRVLQYYTVTLLLGVDCLTL